MFYIKFVQQFIKLFIMPFIVIRKIIYKKQYIIIPLVKNSKSSICAINILKSKINDGRTPASFFYKFLITVNKLIGRIKICGKMIGIKLYYLSIFFILESECKTIRRSTTWHVHTFDD